MASPEQHPDRIVLHIAGADRPGVTARLTEIIAAENADLVDIGQSVLHGYLMLSAIVDVPITSNAFRQILFAVNDLGLRLEVSPYRADRGTSTPSEGALAVTVLGELKDGGATARITRLMAESNLNIREIRSLSDRELTGLELIADLKPAPQHDPTALTELRGKLLALGMELGVDLAVQKDDIFRRDKRLVCMDVDSTFVKGELIDELASLVGAKEQVAAITARAMRGEIDFKGALNERVKLLEGLPFEKAKALADRSELTPGADRFVRLLQGLGYRI
ncbi:MAG TPA: ACT domain-containing protein, partial [Polyangiaceae bacterium]|nr:ACT domain-containing protein [Polyangiaceae bacterium]